MNEIQGAFYILHGGDFRQMIGLPKCMEEIHRLIHFLHQMIKHLRCQGLGTVAEGFLRIVVDLDHETVSSGCDRGSTMKRIPAAWLGSMMTGR